EHRSRWRAQMPGRCAVSLVVAARRRPNETNRGAIRVARDGGSEDGVFNSLARANIERRTPTRALIVADRDKYVIVRCRTARSAPGVGEIHCAVAGDGDRRIDSGIAG